jgi:two-component system nitrate/nitrite response regulator NarL
MPPIRALLVADDPIARAGLAALLEGEPKVELAGSGTLAQAAALVAGEEPEVLCWDPGERADGAARLLAAAAGRPIVALVGRTDAGAELLRAGIHALLGREATGAALAAALRAAASGLSVLAPRLASAWLRPPAPLAGGADALTPREREVLALLAEGLGNKGIAARLGLSEHTAKFHVNAILSKLGAGSRAEAIVLAARRGLVML